MIFRIKTTPIKNRTNYSLCMRGFSLIEVLVALSLFTIVTTVSVGTLMVLIDANIKQQGAQVIVTNVSFALDSMTREIRTGFHYYCRNNIGNNSQTTGTSTRNCPHGANSLVITESGQSLTEGKGSRRIAYRHNPADQSIQRRLGTTGVWQTITASEVNITTLDFIVTGTSTTDSKSPTVTIFIEGTSEDVERLDTSFQIQTTVTQHNLDI